MMGARIFRRMRREDKKLSIFNFIKYIVLVKWKMFLKYFKYGFLIVIWYVRFIENGGRGRERFLVLKIYVSF